MPLLIGLGIRGTVGVLLVLVHLAADFILQSEELAQRKKESLPDFLVHQGHVALLYMIPLLIFWSLPMLVTVVLVTVAHVVIDAVKIAIGPRISNESALLLGDQAVHLLTIGAVWHLFLPTVELAPYLAGLSIKSVPWPKLTVALGLLSALIALTRVSNISIRTVLDQYDVGPEEDDDYSMGRKIGNLERLIIFLLVLIGEWSAIAIIIGAKSVARFDRLRERKVAEYYLIGTLLSLLAVIFIGVVVRLYLGSPSVMIDVMLGTPG